MPPMTQSSPGSGPGSGPRSGAVPIWLASASEGFECASESVDAEVRCQHTLVCMSIDRYFAWLMLAQWAAVVALSLSSSTGAGGSPHAYLALALVYGGLLTLVPVALTRIAPGEHLTRLTIAVTQMLMSFLLIHLSGGRMEAHIFASLAFLAFYLDWQLLVAASAVIVADRLLSGIFLPHSFPQSILASAALGSTTVQSWRWLELTCWILFCDIFLVAVILDRLRSLRELTAHHVERGKLLYGAYHDALTGLPNRASLVRKLTQAIDESQAGNAVFACLYLDLDRLKDVNDHFGHASGDTLLHLVAHRIKARLGEHAFLARVGGDEFVALIAPPQPESSSESSPSSLPRSLRASEVARSLLRSLRPPFELEDNHIVVAASIGISLYPRDGQDPADLLTNSERAMYRVKRTGRNDVLVFTPAMFSDARDSERAERDLCVAIEEGELQVHYQPIFHASGPVAGLEALLRWSHPTRGNIPPSEFIPLAEETGLIVQLGSFVLHEACRQASDWRNRGLLTGCIAVNVSSLELSREDYAESVILTLRQHYTPPDAIELEVTESALVHDFVLAERHLGELRRYGIRISIDDFGTGYSALGRLRQLTLDTLKIDRLFVEGVAGLDRTPGHAPDRTVVQHIIDMAHTLGMTVVAEGVETESQRAILCSLGCDQLQGFLLARPMNRQLAEDRLLLNAATLPIEDDPLSDTCARV